MGAAGSSRIEANPNVSSSRQSVQRAAVRAPAATKSVKSNDGSAHAGKREASRPEQGRGAADQEPTETRDPQVRVAFRERITAERPECRAPGARGAEPGRRRRPGRVCDASGERFRRPRRRPARRPR